ncbi:MAG TPA: GDP-mannose 4,6-dehydratase [Patescibacteria group bacterium]|nr:GDP-mannose 4,6-dehydratase [Patescibacteria group bacterium]
MNTRNSTALATGRENVILTGAAGFIGANLAEDLVKRYNVVAIDNFITGDEKNIDNLLQLPNFEFIRHDIAEPFDLTGYPELRKFQIDVQGISKIFNLACPTAPKDHAKYAMEIIGANSVGVQNMLNMAVKYKATFIHASSQHIYGMPKDNNPIKEDYFGYVNSVGPRSAYDEGKRFAESVIGCYQRQFGVDAKIARIFTTYGPKMALHEGRSVPDFIINAINNEDLIVYGDENTQNTFCYIDDIVDGLVKLANSNISTPVNLGHYEKYSLKNAAELIIKMTESKSKIVYRNPEWYVASYNIPDITLAKETLGWFPLVGLGEGLERTIKFTKINLRLYQS